MVTTRDLESVEGTSLSDCIEEEEIQASVVTNHSSSNGHSQQYSMMHRRLVSSGIAPKGVHELLECPVCTNSMYPPIHQCPNGHTLCSTCKSRVHNRCPTCRQELGDIRCLALEKVAESLELPCKYYSLGCLEIFPYYSKLKHEAVCNLRPFNCPYAGSECAVTGNIPYLVSHLRDDHKVDMHTGYTFNHRYVKSNPREVENATWMLTVFHCFGQYFCLHFEAFQLGMAPVYMAFLRFMGDRSGSSQLQLQPGSWQQREEADLGGNSTEHQGQPQEGEGQPRRAHHPTKHGALLLRGRPERAQAQSHRKNMEGAAEPRSWCQRPKSLYLKIVILVLLVAALFLLKFTCEIVALCIVFLL